MTKTEKAASNENRRCRVVSMRGDRLVYLASYQLPRMRGEDILDGDCIERVIVA